MKILSFNVNGIRAIAKKEFFANIVKMDADLVCLQETKASVEQVKETLSKKLNEYHIYACEAERKGYSGTAILTKVEPLKVTYGIGISEHDKEGRVITAEFNEYYVISVYVPNSGNDLRRLDYRQRWDKDFLDYLKKLDKVKPVMACGDFNVAHKEIDLARPKANYNKSAGFMQEEIDGMDAYIGYGFIDSFRHLNKDVIKYSWWSYRGGARDRNVGWRIDNVLVSQRLKDRINEAYILNEITGSDHCPVGINLK